MKKVCQKCGKIFCCPKSHFGRRIFCSKKCFYDSRKGIPFFDSTGTPSWNKGLKGVMKSWNKGKTGVYSAETLEKMRTASLRKQGPLHNCWKGGVRIHNGYRMIFNPKHPFANKNKSVYEHRLVMEKYLGRFLEPKEVVHHKNGDKLDNRIDNLVLFSSNSEHLLFHSSCGDIKGRPKKK